MGGKPAAHAQGPQERVGRSERLVDLYDVRSLAALCQPHDVKQDEERDENPSTAPRPGGRHVPGEAVVDRVAAVGEQCARRTSDPPRSWRTRS